MKKKEEKEIVGPLHEIHCRIVSIGIGSGVAEAEGECCLQRLVADLRCVEYW